jgi:hypothetical protein
MRKPGVCFYPMLHTTSVHFSFVEVKTRTAIVSHICKRLIFVIVDFFNGLLLFRAPNSVVRSLEIHEKRTEDNKCLYAIAQKTFDSIPDLVASYRTYDFNEVVSGSTGGQSVRLGKPVPREKWYQELMRKPWYQPDLTSKQAEELLRGVSTQSIFVFVFFCFRL